MARAAKLTPKLIESLCEHLKQGQPQRAAAALVGIHRITLIRWMNRGRLARSQRDEGVPVKRSDAIYLTLLDEIEYALDYGEGWLMQQALEAIKDPKAGRWQGYVTLLERTRPDGWRRRSSAEYAGEKGQPPVKPIDVGNLDRTERAQLRALLEKARDDAS